MKELLQSQTISVIIGACLTLFISLVTNRQKHVNCLNEEIAKERISAYKRIYKLVSKLNDNIAPKDSPKIPGECYLGYIRISEREYHMSYCFPTVFINFQAFHTYKAEFSFVLNDSRIFLDQSVMNKLTYLDSYLGEIWFLANGKSDEYLHMLGVALSNEIADICRSIEDNIQTFFSTGKFKTKKNNFGLTYKYQLECRKNSELFTLFSDNNEIKQFGDFPLCLNCSFHEKCPLNFISADSISEEYNKTGDDMTPIIL